MIQLDFCSRTKKSDPTPTVVLLGIRLRLHPKTSDSATLLMTPSPLL